MATTTTKRTAYDVITDRVISLLEAGTVPWHKSWHSADPRNLISGKCYRGINAFILPCAGYNSPYWLTYRQAKQLGGNVRKGEKSCPIVFWNWSEKTSKETGEPERFAFLKYYSGFNLEQCDGIPEEKIPVVEQFQPREDVMPIEQCESVIANMPSPPRIEYTGMQPVYSQHADRVRIPPADHFLSDEEFYSTLFHELTHSTGHKSRLNRLTNARYGSQSYSKEELIAEMGAAFLCAKTGIETRTIDNSAAYIAGWLARLREDSKLVVSAAAAAQRAVDFILDVKYENN